MGGVVPLGYRVEYRKLVIDETEAQTVRHLFARYLILKSARALAEEAKRDGLSTRSKRCKDGLVGPPSAFGRGKLYYLLSNPIYIGKIRHKDQIYEGGHGPIIDPETFEAAQLLLSSQASPRRSGASCAQMHLLMECAPRGGQIALRN